MDMLKYKSLVEEGDLVIVYLDIRHMYPLTVKRDEVFQSKYGALKHNDIIGSKFGSCVSCTKGWVYVLFPTPELWTITLPHRTQILYAADISLIIVQLDLKPGSIVCEAGTGSGSLSHALIRAVAPDGFLHTFEFHEKRAEVAQEEFKSHGLSHLVKVERRDVCSDGFGIMGVADAVFLDLPNPWEAVPHAATAIKESGGRICSFSPCIEQVQRTCLAMQVSGFRDIVTVECLQRTLEVKKITQTIISFDKYDRVKLTPEPNQKLEAEVEESNQEKPTKDGETVTHWTALPPLQSAGHTGYLTYASFLNFSESQ